MQHHHPRLQRVRGSRAFGALGRFVLRQRTALLAATLGLSAFCGYRAFVDLSADTGDEVFLRDGARAAEVLEAVRTDFGEDAMFQLLVAGDVFSLPYLERLRALHDEVGALDLAQEAPAPSASASGSGSASSGDDFGFAGDEGWGDETGGSIVEDAVSLINARQTLPSPDGIRVEGLLQRAVTTDDLPRLRERVLGDRTLVGQVVDAGGTHSVLAVRTRKLTTDGQTQLFEALQALAREHSRPGFEVMVGGAPAVTSALRGMMISDTWLTMALTTVVLLLVTALFFRHPIGVLGPPLVVWQAELWTLGAMAISDTPLTLVTTILPAFIGCVGLGDSIHVQSVYRNARAEGMDNDEAIVYAVATTGMPVLLTTLTTAMGLLSFRLASLGPIRDMGTFGALGVMAALVNSVIFLPIVLSFNRTSLLGLPAQHTATRLDRIIDFCDRLTKPVPRRNQVLAASALLTLAAALGVAQLRVHHDGLRWFPDDHPTRVAIDRLEGSVGGTANVTLLIEPKPGADLKDRESLLALQRLERHILSYSDGRENRIVRNTTSVLDPVRESWRAVHHGDAERYAVPDTQRGVHDMFTLFENAGSDYLGQLATVDLERALMTVRVKWLSATEYLPLTAHIERGIERLTADVLDIETTGSVYLAVSVIVVLLDDLLRSFGAAALVITLVMIFVLKNLKLGALAMLPNLLPVLTVMGFMGYAGIPLDTSTLMLGSVAIGIVVDDTIHFLHQFKAYHDQHGDVDGAVRHAFLHTGRAMFATSLILVSGLLCPLAAQLLSSKLFGMLLGMTVVAALVLDFTFTPALLRFAYRERPARYQKTPQGAPAQ